MNKFRLSFYIARKYFLSRKNTNFINILSLVSVIALMVGACALFIVLSVFNGMTDLIRNVHGSFDPEIVIKPTSGKTMELTPEFLTTISDIEGVDIITEVIEDDAFINYQGTQKVVRVKGVTPNYHRQNNIDSSIIEGKVFVQDGGRDYAVLGIGLHVELGVSLANDRTPLQIYYPKRNKKVLRESTGSFNRINILPGGVFALERQYDESYIIVPIDYAELLFEYPNERTAIEIRTTQGFSIASVIDELKITLGNDYKVLNSEQQHESLYKAMKVEKLVVYIIFAFVLCIAAVNIFLTITMIIISKKKDMAILKSFGADESIIRTIFLLEGALIGIIGTGSGLLLGFIICYVQQKFGIVQLQAQATLVNAFPVKMMLNDFLLTGLTTIVITILVSLHPSIKASRIGIKEEI